MKKFTLIELILAVVIIAMAGAMTASIVGAVANHENRSELLMDRASELHDVCEKITSAYKNASPVDLSSLSIAVGNVGNEMQNVFGAYKVVNNGYIEFVLTNGSWTETASTDGSKYHETALKITISHLNGPETTTMVFTDESKVKPDPETP